jgi:hypothetical protein
VPYGEYARKVTWYVCETYDLGASPNIHPKVLTNVKVCDII